jgi:hypothetical protein
MLEKHGIFGDFLRTNIEYSFHSSSVRYENEVLGHGRFLASKPRAISLSLDGKASRTSHLQLISFIAPSNLCGG